MPKIKINPEIEKRPVLPPGDYPGELVSIKERPLRWDKERMGVSFDVSVRHENTIVHVYADKDPEEQGSILPKWFAQLGIPREVQAQGEIDTDPLEGQKVVVTVGLREYTNRDGERVPQNTLRNIALA